MCRFLTTSMMTWARAVVEFSKSWSSLPKCSSTCVRSAGVTSTWRPVYSKSIPDPFRPRAFGGGRGLSPQLPHGPLPDCSLLNFNAERGRRMSVIRHSYSNHRLALARARNLHLVAVLRNGAARQLDAFPG